MVVGHSRSLIREETKSNQSQGAEISVKPGEGERMRSPSVQIIPIPLSLPALQSDSKERGLERSSAGIWPQVPFPQRQMESQISPFSITHCNRG